MMKGLCVCIGGRDHPVRPEWTGKKEKNPRPESQKKEAASELVGLASD